MKLSGYPEFLPEQRIVEQRVVERLTQTFERWGFASVQTRSVEPIEELLRKGEIDKEVYVVRRLHAAADDADRLALHFDLTVPFARYVVDHAGQLQFPFRRYQIQQAWRGERPQDGRYREFTQADIDIVGDGQLAAHHDAEVAAAMVDALSGLDLPPLTLLLNNRKLVQGFYRGLGVEDTGAALRLMDKRDKVSPDVIDAGLRDLGLGDRGADLARAFADIRSADSGFVGAIEVLGVSDEMMEEGIAELVDVLAAVGRVAGDAIGVRVDLSVARGLDYYTGTVFETTMAGYESLGSVCSGGRYDTLATSGTRTFPGVGISFGVTRTLAPLLARGALSASRSTPTVVVVAVSAESERSRSDEIAAALRARGLSAHTAPTADRFGAQIRYADRRGIPFVWFPDSGEIKDIRTGDQVPADPHSWAPPAPDLRPQIIRGTT